MTLRTLLLASALSWAPGTLAQPSGPQPVPGGAGVETIVFHDGQVVFLAAEGPARLVRLDPATGPATALPDDAPSWGLWSVAGGLYVQTEDEGRLQALDPATGRLSPAPEPFAWLTAYDLARLTPAAGGQVYAVLYASDDGVGVLSAVGPDGRATAVEPDPPAGERDLQDPTLVGEAVYYSVGLPDPTYGAVDALWRAAGGAAGPVDVLPADEVAGRSLTLATAGGALLIAVSDRETFTSRLWRLAPGDTRAVLVPAFSADADLSFGLFRGLGDAYLFTVPNDLRRVRLYRGTGDAAPALVEGLDLGYGESFFDEAVREYDGALYAWGYAPGDDPAQTATGLFRVDPAAGPARLVARYVGAGFPRVGRPEEGFVVAGGRVYFSAYEESGTALVSLPLDTAAPRGR